MLCKNVHNCTFIRIVNWLVSLVIDINKRPIECVAYTARSVMLLQRQSEDFSRAMPMFTEFCTATISSFLSLSDSVS